ncbi:hypothetical protein GCM10017714_03880 [Curtobacterium pusillum]|uniref:Lipoprotein n=1 Tax=Curtobacterium pusillum TaxID=69373 RepID=A0AAW3T9W2_9MICO|nr:hypothetical protein [Curtobacterium pusillum]MBA8991674.1 hypothetical protein [Curtobacterium pusillum]NUU13973.1 hypothetical protein [Curtobacterium pusillum]GLK31120.1 hypothetical protein GCM10017610_14050 [Curtobacterium pusillum]
MQLAPRPIAALAVVGALSLLAAGCSAGGDDPTPSPTSTATASASPTPTAVETGGSSTPSTGGDDDGSDDVPTAFPGSGQTSQPDTDPSDFPATAVVTFAGWDAGSKTLQAGGLVSGTTDTSGTCTFAATKSGVTRTLTSAAQASASSVNCAQVSFPSSQVSTGTWSITLKYTVGSKSTTSEPMTAEVP